MQIKEAEEVKKKQIDCMAELHYGIRALIEEIVEIEGIEGIEGCTLRLWFVFQLLAIFVRSNSSLLV